MSVRRTAGRDGREKYVFRCDIDGCRNTTERLIVTDHYNQNTGRTRTVDRRSKDAFAYWREIVGVPKGRNRNCKPFYLKKMSGLSNRRKQAGWHTSVFVQCWEHGGDKLLVERQNLRRRRQQAQPQVQVEPRIPPARMQPQSPVQMRFPFGEDRCATS